MAVPRALALLQVRFSLAKARSSAARRACYAAETKALGRLCIPQPFVVLQGWLTESARPVPRPIASLDQVPLLNIETLSLSVVVGSGRSRTRSSAGRPDDIPRESSRAKHGGITQQTTSLMLVAGKPEVPDYTAIVRFAAHEPTNCGVILRNRIPVSVRFVMIPVALPDIIIPLFYTMLPDEM